MGRLSLRYLKRLFLLRAFRNLGTQLCDKLVDGTDMEPVPFIGCVDITDSVFAFQLIINDIVEGTVEFYQGVSHK